MLPLISNALPSTPTVPSQSAPANASLILSASTDAAAAGRQQLPNAVLASGAPVAYFPGTAPQRTQAQGSDRIQRIPAPPPTGDYVEVEQLPQPVVAQRMSVPVTLGIPLTTQLTAQFMAQQAARAALPTTPDELFVAAPREEKPAPAKAREPSLATAKGTAAYGIAAARTAAVEARANAQADEAIGT